MSEYENMRRDYDRMRAAEEEKLKQLGRVEVLQELRELVEKWRRNDVAYTVMHQNSHYGQCAKELEALLASAEDPPCTRCGQKINGPAPRGICGDCTAEGPEQAARERLCCVRCGGYVERSYATGDCYAPDCEPQHMSSHDEAQPYCHPSWPAEAERLRRVVTGLQAEVDARGKKLAALVEGLRALRDGLVEDGHWASAEYAAEELARLIQSAGPTG